MLIKNIASKSASEIKKIFSELSPSVTSLDLSDNSLNALPLEALIATIAAIPANVTSVHLANNNLFVGKSPQERDELINALTPYNTHGRLNLEQNGESTQIRAASLLIEMQRQGTVVTGKRIDGICPLSL